MFPQERKDFIKKSLMQSNSIKVNEIAKYFKVSESTIRRDLQEMEEMNLLTRTHGGAVNINKINFEPSFSKKGLENYDEKKIISEIAVNMINEGDTIIMDSGTTTLEIARRLSTKNITVITNSIDIVYELSTKEGIKVIVTGGQLRQVTRAMVGDIANKVLRGFKVNKAFIGVNGISVKDGISTPNLVESQTKRAMIESANQVIVVADSTKFNKVSFSIVSPIDKIDAIITTSKSKDLGLKEYEERGISFITE